MGFTRYWSSGAVVVLVVLQGGSLRSSFAFTIYIYLWLLGDDEVAVYVTVLYTINRLLFLLLLSGWPHLPHHVIASCTSLSHIRCMLVTSISHCHCMLVTSLSLIIISCTFLSLLHCMLALSLSLAHCMLHHVPLLCTLYVASRTSHTLDIFSILVLSVMCLLHFLSFWFADVDVQGSKRNAIYIDAFCRSERYVCWMQPKNGSISVYISK